MTAYVKIHRAILDFERKRVLWPARWSYKALIEKRNELGTLIFNCEYQNDPSGLEGRILKGEWLKFWDELPPLKELSVYQSWDLAISEEPDADYTACCTFARHRTTGKIYILEWFRDRIDFPSQVAAVQKEYAMAKRLYGRPKSVFIEENAYQKALVQQVRLLGGIPVVGVKTNRNKEEKITAFSPWFENGTVLLKRDGLHVDEFIAEYLQFPEGAHDDMLDALVLGVTKALQGQRYRSRVF